MKRILITYVAALAILAAPCAFCAEVPSDRPVKYVRGRIYNVDYTGSRITLQWFYTTGKISQDKIIFSLSENVRVLTDRNRIFKNIRRAGVTDLIKGDHVIVRYYDDAKRGYPEAVEIRILEHDLPIAP